MGYVLGLRKHIGTRPIIVPGSSVLCFNNKGELLLIKRSDNHQWGLPGGSLELGEKLEETAFRELFEETGVQAQNLIFHQIYSGKNLHSIYPNGDEVYNVVAVYTCEYDGNGWNNDSEEALDVQFWSLKNLPAHMCSPDRFVIEKMKEGIHW